MVVDVYTPPICDVPRMLISDDDRDLRESLSQAFVARGFETILAEDGREAFEAACRSDVHLALIDFHMPRMTGLQAIMRIRQHRKHLPIILMSAELDVDDLQNLRAANLFSFHKKPIDIASIRTDVALALRKIYNWSIEN